MSAHRTRKRTRPTPPDPRADLPIDFDELSLLWGRLGDALVRDRGTTEVETADRHAVGGAKGSSAAVNLDVLEVATLVEVGVREFEAQAVRILGLAPVGRSVAGILGLLPVWWEAISSRPTSAPLAAELVEDAQRWLRMMRRSVGLMRSDRKIGIDCPDHRDDAPTGLLQVGSTAQLHASLIEPMPSFRPVDTIGPLCVEHWRACAHESCRCIRTQTWEEGDWIWRGGRWVWRNAAGTAEWERTGHRTSSGAYTWRSDDTVRCPRCRRRWVGTRDRRLLAMELRALGDHVPDDFIAGMTE